MQSCLQVCLNGALFEKDSNPSSLVSLRFYVLMDVKIKIPVFRHMTPCRCEEDSRFLRNTETYMCYEVHDITS
jgi:hypothetical protein